MVLNYDATMTGESNKRVIGYAPGAYDLFHVGHLNLLRKAKQQCDYLIAGVVSDEILLLNKGTTPVIPLSERLEIVRSVRFVDEAVAEMVSDKIEMWKQLHFDILFKGDDWQGTEKGDRLEKCFAEHQVKIVYFPYTQFTSSSLLRKSLAKLNGVRGKTEQNQTTEAAGALTAVQPAVAVRQGIEKEIPLYKATTLFFLKPRFQKALRPFTNALANAAVTANQITILGIAGSILISAILLYFNSYPAIFYLLPLWLFIRMGFNTVDGLLAIEHGHKSRVGGILNEGGDMLSDLLLAAPLALINPANHKMFFLLMTLSIVSESAGIAGSRLGGERCNFGPFGKTDRAIAFGCIGMWLAIFGRFPVFMPHLVIVFIGLHVMTIFNRVFYLI
jgi:glycerol-3-phosphate cytidylyltransferase